MRRVLAAVLYLVLCSPAFAQRLTPQSNYGESNNGFPSWEERAVAELTNRARVDPATDLAGCPAGQCGEAACYSPTAPLLWNYDLDRSSRFHSATMAQFPFFAHDTPCAVFSDISSRYPGSSTGTFATSCSGSGTTPAATRISMFGVSMMGENIAAGYSTPYSTFYQWFYENSPSTACGFSSANGHRYNILTSGPALGVGYATGPGQYTWYWTQDFGGSGTMPKIPSGSHWTSAGHVRDATSGDANVEFWANWYDSAAPTLPTIVLDGVPATMTLARGTAANGAYSVTIANVSAACHTYYFQFTDSGATIVRYPTTGALGFGAGCPDYQSAAPPSAPTGVVASPVTSTQVQITWNAVAGATSYQIWRRNPGGAFTMINTSLTPSYTDTSVSANVAYLYRIRTVAAGGTSVDSAYDLVTTVPFTNDPLSAGLTIRAAHLQELRTAVEAVRSQAGVGAGTYTDTPAVGLTVKAVHITELRSNLDQAMSALGLTTGGWTGGAAAGGTITATHFQEIRDRTK